MDPAGAGGAGTGRGAALLRALPLLSALLLAGVLLRNAWVSDDAYITFRALSNLLHGEGLVWNPGERVQSFTHPLWLLLHLPFALLGQRIFFVTVALSLALSLAAWRTASAPVSERSPEAAAVLLLGLLASRSFVDYATSGLENPLTFLLLALFAHRLLAAGEEEPRPGGLFLIAGLAALNRLDTILFYLPALLALGVRRRPRRVLGAAAVGFAPLAAWEAFSFFYYGFLFPNTRYAKLGTGVGAADSLGQGLRYLGALLLHDPAGALLLALLLAVALSPLAAGSRRGAAAGPPPRSALLALGGLLYGVYVVLIGGDFMAGRHWSAPVFLGALLGSRSIAGLPVPSRRRIAAALALALAAAGLAAAPPPAGTNPSGILDERATYFPTNSLRANLAGVAVSGSRAGLDLRELAEAAGAPGPVTVVAGFAVGAEGYFAGPRVRIVDYLGLCDPLLARLPVYDPGQWAPGHFVREIPSGYLAALRGGGLDAMDPDLARYYGRLRLVVSGPLWSLERLRTALALNLGAFDGARERYLRPKRLGPLPLASFEGRPGAGAPRDAPGVLAVPTRREVEVAVEPPRTATALEMSAGAAADCDLVFLRRGEPLGEARWRAVPGVPGSELGTRVVALPVRLAREPFDTLLLRPRPRSPWVSLSREFTRPGDGATFSDYAIGRLRLR